jgi:hypothetical protein
VGSAFHTSYNVGVQLQITVYGFQFCWWGSQSAQRLTAGLFYWCGEGLGAALSILHILVQARVVCDAHLYLWRFHAGIFRAS